MNLFRYDIELKIEAPVVSQALGAVGLGLDTVLHRDLEGHPALPGSLLRGNLRHAWRELGALNPVAFHEDTRRGWLGKKSDNGVEPNRARLLFDSWWVDEIWDEKRDVGIRHRIRIDEATGTAARGAIQFIECPYASGEEISFKGAVHAWMDDSDEAKRLDHWLRKGLAYLPALGAVKGSGFGRLAGVNVNYQILPPRQVDWPNKQPARISLRLHLDRPFCTGRPAVGENNRFDSEDFLPGAALIGTIAQRMDLEGRSAWPILSENLDAIHVTHALPVAKGDTRRPLAPPLSFAQVKENLYDLALKKGPGLINGVSPAFQPDWKLWDWDKANTKCGIQEPRHLLTVRTAINEQTGAAAEGKLFAMETIDPRSHDWLATLDLGMIPADRHVGLIAELKQIFAMGLDGLGKTKARATVTLESTDGYIEKERPWVEGETVVLVLQTPARLLATEFAPPGTDGSAALREAYEQAWTELSESSLSLSHYYARQHLLGGDYWWKRFNVSTNGDRAYHPEIFTDAGSVFVLDVKDETQAKKCLEVWCRYGLPQLKDAPGGENWEKNPWTRANGYGELVINREMHWDEDLVPTGEEWNGLDD